MTLLPDWPVTLSSLGEASISYPQQVIRRLVTEYESQSNPLSPLIENLISNPSASTVTALSFTGIAGLLVLVLVAAMSWRDTFSFLRRLPSYNTSHTSHAPQVNDSDFTYLTENDIVEPPRTHHSYAHHVRPRPPVGADYQDDSGPDILLLKHRGVTYPLHFQPYAIDDGDITVGELRRRAAEKVGTSELRRIRLLYKGKVLRDDARACKDEGLKQQSEIMCVVVSELEPGESTSDLSGSEIGNRSESVMSIDSGINDHHQDEAAGKNKKSKKNKKKKKKNAQAPKPTSDSLAPPSDARPTSSGRSSAAPSPAPSLNQFSTGSEQVEALLRYLRTELAPLFDQYLAQPPTDPKVREYEHKRLGETILAQVIIKADSIESEDARTARRALIKEAQSMLSKLDAAVPQDKP